VGLLSLLFQQSLTEVSLWDLYGKVRNPKFQDNNPNQPDPSLRRFDFSQLRSGSLSATNEEVDWAPNGKHLTRLTFSS
jgi:hypothetical protein